MPSWRRAIGILLLGFRGCCASKLSAVGRFGLASQFGFQKDFRVRGLSVVSYFLFKAWSASFVALMLELSFLEALQWNFGRSYSASYFDHVQTAAPHPTPQSFRNLKASS